MDKDKHEVTWTNCVGCKSKPDWVGAYIDPDKVGPEPFREGPECMGCYGWAMDRWAKRRNYKLASTIDVDGIKDLLKNDRKIHAIKYYREVTGYSLRDSKDIVDIMQRALLNEQKSQKRRLLKETLTHYEELIREASSPKYMADNCPLCKKYEDEDCEGCPIAIETGQRHCDGTPHHLVRQTGRRHVRTLKSMRDWLERLSEKY